MIYELLNEEIRAERPAALATVIEGSPERVGLKLFVRPGREAVGSLGHPDLDRVVQRDVLGELAAGQTLVRHYGAEGQAREDTLSVFIESFAAPPQMLIFGAVDFTGAGPWRIVRVKSQWPATRRNSDFSCIGCSPFLSTKKAVNSTNA